MTSGSAELLTPPLLRLPEAAQMLRISVGTLRVWINKGKISYVRPGKEYLIKRSTINAFIDKQSVDASKNAALYSRRKKPVRKVPPSNNAQENAG